MRNSNAGRADAAIFARTAIPEQCLRQRIRQACARIDDPAPGTWAAIMIAGIIGDIPQAWFDT
jgi:hypothetical protein